MSFDHFIISAIPNIRNVNPKKIFVFNQAFSALTETNIVLRGGTFFTPQYVYLSASDSTMFNNLSVYTLSSHISGHLYTSTISAVLIPEFSYTEHYLDINLPNIPNAVGFFDIIVQNEAGYGSLLTSLNPEISSGIQVLEI